MDKFIDELEARFLRYVQMDTQSDETSRSVPSTEKQRELLQLLWQELEALGAHDVELTDYACLLATIPATVSGDSEVPTVAFLAHVDTSPDFSGHGVRPVVHRNYDGQPIVLPDDTTQIIDPDEFPELAKKVGHDVVTASGTTLLGADDKAGVAIMMTLAAHLLGAPQIPHGPVRLCFTPDEEIGRGVEHLTPEDLAADVGYTLDGGSVGEVTFESFSADKALVTITGVSTHTGKAKGKMVNATRFATRFAQMLPQESCTPETTEDREGFIHLYRMQGATAKVELHFLLRDFEMEGLRAQGALLRKLAASLMAEEPRLQIEVDIMPQYRNMRYWLEKDMLPVELALQALERQDIEADTHPIRGGTDGAGLTAKGVPTPNLFTGMQNPHSPLEWISLQDMATSTQFCLDLVQLWAGQDTERR